MTESESSRDPEGPALRAVFLDAGDTLIHPDRALILGLLADTGVERTRRELVDAERVARDRVRAKLSSARPGDDADRGAVYWRTLLETLGVDDGDGRLRRTLDAIHRSHDRHELWTRVESGTGEVLGRLRSAGHVLGVISNADGNVETLLERAGLRPFFDFVIDSGEVGIEKPDPRIFRLACRTAGVRPGEAVHVGDFQAIDVAGARSAGLHALLLDPDGVHTGEVERIESLSELPGWVDARARAGAEV